MQIVAKLLFWLTACLLLSCSDNFESKRRSESLTLWIKKFNDLNKSSELYRYRNEHTTQDDIFPRPIEELHKWSSECETLKSETEWKKFANEIEIIYYKYSEMPISREQSSLSGSERTIVARKNGIKVGINLYEVGLSSEGVVYSKSVGRVTD